MSRIRRVRLCEFCEEGIEKVAFCKIRVQKDNHVKFFYICTFHIVDLNIKVTGHEGNEEED